MLKTKTKIALLYILIFASICVFCGCNKTSTTINGTTMDFRIETLEGNRIRECITIKLDTNNYDVYSGLNEDKANILSYLEYDTTKHLNAFKRLAKQSTTLSKEIKEEYIYHNPIDFESKNVNNSNMIQFDMLYKNNNIRQVWYYFLQTFDGSKGVILDYNDEEIFGNSNNDNSNENEVLIEHGTWFNKSYILTSSVYDYALIPYPTFKNNFVNIYPNVTFTQTLISAYDNLKTNAIKETLYQGGIVERTWVVDINSNSPIEYYVLQANRVSWYILALAISCFIVVLLFVIYIIKRINKKRHKFV